MPILPSQRALAYLYEHHVMSLATSNNDGMWAAAVFYASDGFELYFLSSPKTRHAINLEANAAVCATIQEDYRDWRSVKGIQLAGHAVRLQGSQRTAAIECYERKFPFVGDALGMAREIASALEMVSWYRLVPSRLLFVDNSLGFGHRDEIALASHPQRPVL